MNILAIDPGTEYSGFVIMQGLSIKNKAKVENAAIKTMISSMRLENIAVVIEMIASYGMPVGKEVFETCLFIGQVQQLCEFYGIKCELVYRKDICKHICMTPHAKDPNIRQALIDRFGQKGTKKAPGLTYGFSGDLWSAFAIAVYYYDTKILKPVSNP